MPAPFLDLTENFYCTVKYMVSAIINYPMVRDNQTTYRKILTI